MTKKIAVFPGTFDPITKGHVDIVKRGLALFDEIIIAIGINTKKQNLFSLEQRKEWIEKIFKNTPAVTCKHYEGLTVEFCKSENAGYLLRGLRNSSDFEYESHIAQLNRQLDNSVETVFIISSPELSHISSTIVRDVIIYGGNYESLVPSEVVVKSP